MKKHIRDNINNKIIEMKIEMRVSDMQQPNGLLYLIRELELDKSNDKAFYNLIDFSFAFSLINFLI